MNLNEKVTAVAAGVVAVIAVAGEAQAAKPVKPNIVVILLDDVGYSDLGCYGSEVPTPNMDRFAEEGIRFRQFYNQARSSPTRVSLLTGLYSHQDGYGSLGPQKGYPAYQGYANNKNFFIPELIRKAGYFNIMTGKWHLGQEKGVTPIKRGFDRSLNAPTGGYYFSNDVSPKQNGTPTNEKNLYLNDEQLRFDDPRLPKEWYSTDLWVDMGLKFVDEAIGTGKPFFWYLAHNGAHFPLQAPQETIAKYRGNYLCGWDPIRNARYEKQLALGLFTKEEPLTPRNPKVPAWDSLSDEERDRYDMQMAIYAAVIDRIDQSIGRLVAHLKEKGVFDNTIFILLSDNGGNGEPGIEGVFKGKNPGSATSTVFLGAAWADVANTPYFLYKHHAHEGGCNTPLIISYPKGIDRKLNGSIIKNTCGHVIDLMPTILEITGAQYPDKKGNIDIPPMEGVSLVPCFSGGVPARKNPIIVEHEGNKMLRDGKWKVVQEYKEPLWMLYDMEKDPTEMNDLAATNPDQLKKMVDEYQVMAKHIGVEPGIEFKIGKWYTPVADYFAPKK